MTTGNTMQRIVFGAERMRPTSAQILALRAHCTRSCLPDHRQNRQELRASGIRKHCSRRNGNRTERFPGSRCQPLSRRSRSPSHHFDSADAGPGEAAGIPGPVRCSNVIERFRVARRKSSSQRSAVFSTRPTGELHFLTPRWRRDRVTLGHPPVHLRTTRQPAMMSWSACFRSVNAAMMYPISNSTPEIIFPK